MLFSHTILSMLLCSSDGLNPSIDVYLSYSMFHLLSTDCKFLIISATFFSVFLVLNREMHTLSSITNTSNFLFNESFSSLKIFFMFAYASGTRLFTSSLKSLNSMRVLPSPSFLLRTYCIQAMHLSSEVIMSLSNLPFFARLRMRLSALTKPNPHTLHMHSYGFSFRSCLTSSAFSYLS